MIHWKARRKRSRNPSIFNGRHNSGKMIVIAGYIEPQTIEGLEERILSQLTWGIVVEIKNHLDR